MMRFIAAAVLCLVVTGANAQGNQWDVLLAPELRASYSTGSVKHSGRVVGGRPAGCPRRYCGCASALKINIPNPGGRLNLALNWVRLFPRTSPAPGMAAARRGHVFIIERVLGPGLVVAFDPNSGGGKTRVHVRSLAGFTVVNPYARRYASAQ